MDLKSIVLNKRMKFFHNITLISSCLFLNWAYPYGVQDIPEPSHLLSYQYSKLHNPQPKSDAPSIACLTWKIPVAELEMSDLSISLPKYLYSMKVDLQYAYECGSYSQLLLEYEHFQSYISVLISHDNDVGYHPVKHYIDISSPKLYGNSNSLSNVNSFGNLTSNKIKTFIETKVTAMKLQGFNL